YSAAAACASSLISSELERGDAKHPFECQRTNRSRVHPRRLEHRQELALLRERDRLVVDAWHIEEDFACARGRDQGGEDRLSRGAVIGDERADFVAAPARPYHAPPTHRDNYPTRPTAPYHSARPRTPPRTETPRAAQKNPPLPPPLPFKRPPPRAA